MNPSCLGGSQNRHSPAASATRLTDETSSFVNSTINIGVSHALLATIILTLGHASGLAPWIPNVRIGMILLHDVDEATPRHLCQELHDSLPLRFQARHHEVPCQNSLLRYAVPGEAQVVESANP